MDVGDGAAECNGRVGLTGLGVIGTLRAIWHLHRTRNHESDSSDLATWAGRCVPGSLLLVSM